MGPSWDVVRHCSSGSCESEGVRLIGRPKGRPSPARIRSPRHRGALATPPERSPRSSTPRAASAGTHGSQRVTKESPKLLRSVFEVRPRGVLPGSRLGGIWHVVCNDPQSVPLISKRLAGRLEAQSPPERNRTVCRQFTEERLWSVSNYPGCAKARSSPGGSPGRLAPWLTHLERQKVVLCSCPM